MFNNSTTNIHHLNNYSTYRVTHAVYCEIGSGTLQAACILLPTANPSTVTVTVTFPVRS